MGIGALSACGQRGGGKGRKGGCQCGAGVCVGGEECAFFPASKGKASSSVVLGRCMQANAFAFACALACLRAGMRTCNYMRFDCKRFRMLANICV
eukprot:354977-Chlamydomonas_euryale.AAC.2